MAGAVAAAGLLPALTWPAQAQAPADPLAPLALDGSPAQAFASHRARECQVFCVWVIGSMLPERSKDDDDFQRTAGRAAEGLQAA